MPPDEIEEAKARRRRLFSTKVLNEQVATLRQDVQNVNQKLDEFLLVATSMAGSIKLGVRALCIIATVLTVGALGLHSPIIELLGHVWVKVIHP